MTTTIQDQPPPVQNDKPAVWDLVIASMEPHVRCVEQVLADMRQRDAVGRERYGTPLQPHNGRDALVDAYQEALDGVAYLCQAGEEGEDVAELFQDALKLCMNIRAAISRRGTK